ncbi:MAG: hypothetical protein LBN27_00885 [Prevotellaceae bacterium]|jgi:hypothetical protein|nr:hypothetical protein [Prevotellaceae bacterium]
MKKLITTISFLAIVAFSAVRADSWSVYTPNFSFVNDKFNVKVTITGATKSVPLPDGRILIVSERSLPFIIDDARGTVSRELDQVLADKFTPSSNMHVFLAANGKIYLQSARSLVYMIAAKNQWISLANSSSPLGFADGELNGLAVDNSNNIVVSGVNFGKPFVAIVDNGARKLDVAFTTIYAATLDKDGTLWFTTDKGLWSLKKGNTDFTQEYADKIYDLQVCENGIFFSTHNGIYKKEDNNFNLLLPQAAYAFRVDKKEIWYAPVGKDGVFLKRYDLETKQEVEYTQKNTPLNQRVIDIQIDKYGNKYFSTGGGFYVMNTINMSQYPAWTQYSPGYIGEEEFDKREHIDLFKTGKNTAIVITNEDRSNRWVGKYENDTWTYKPFNPEKEATTFGIPGTMPSCIAQTDKGIFVGSLNGGLLQYDFETGVAKNVAGYDIKQFGDKIKDLEADKNGNLWIAAEDGLLKYDGTSFTLYNKKNSALLSKSINVLQYVAETNTLWVGTKDGVFTFDGTNWTEYGKKQGLKPDNVRGLAVSGNKAYVYISGGINMNTTQPLAIIDNGVVTIEKAPAWFAGIVLDDNGTLWLAGSQGLMYKKNNESITLYPSNKYPNIFSMNISMKYYFNNEILFYTHKDSTFGVCVGSGTPVGEVCPLEAIAKQYKGRINSLNKEVVFMFNVNN